MDPDKRAFKKWKDKWDQRIRLLSLKEDGKDWDYILGSFKEAGEKEKVRKSWYGDFNKIVKEIHEIEKAARLYKSDEEFHWANTSHELQLNGIDAAKLQEDQENMWRKIAELIPVREKRGKWTADKVKYAWYHGASIRCKGITLDGLEGLDSLDLFS